MHRDSALGILVLGFVRDRHLAAVLESLRRQGALGQTRVWLDGTAGERREFAGKSDSCRAVARRFEQQAREVYCARGHLGIEKLMLDGLAHMARHHDRILVLEDDCFPARNAVEVFDAELRAVADDGRIYSVYGHPFGVPAEGETFTRFQGWGWGTTAAKLRPVLDQLRECFLMCEREYLEWAAAQIDDAVRARLDVTPPRNVLRVLVEFFSWDSCTALLTARAGLWHKRTPERTIYNCGMDELSGHFGADQRFLAAPFNMIPLDRVWEHF